MLSLVLAATLCSPVTTPFTGTLCAPNDGKRHAAMLLLGGSEGGDSMAPLARQFADHGYVTASVAYFKAPGVQPTLVDVPVETVKQAIDAVSARSDVNADRIGVLGLSKGGELSLLVASTYPQIRAVIAVVPSPFAYMGLGQYGRATACSWTVNAKTLPCIPPSPQGNAIVAAQAQAGKPIRLKPFYEAARTADPAVTDAAYFPLQRIRGPVLCLAAQDDQIWNSPEQCALALQYLHRHHHPYADRSIVYPGAGHLFILAADGPQHALNVMTTPGGSIAFGGTPQADATAGSAAFKQIWAYLASALGP